MLGVPKTSKSNKIYLIDFGLCSQYLNENGAHIKQVKNYNSVVGTALFASINAHSGCELSRKDDIESLIYTLIYLLTGGLPWKNICI
jgi:serine/threonine protein kinase